MLKWVQIGDDIRTVGKTYRAKVPGGWLVYVFTEDNEGDYPYAHGGLTFVPETGQPWELY
jgi:hypothetical protein